MKTVKFQVAAIVLACQSIAPATDKPPHYTILKVKAAPKIDGRLDEPAWKNARSVGAFQFPWYKQGKKEQTDARMLWDKKYLYVSFRCQDAHVWSVHKKHDDPVYKDDCVEVFTSPDPDHPERYFNIEMNVNRAWLDRYHPEGPGKKPPANWNAKGMRIATTVQGTLNDDSDTDRSWILEAAIPLSNFAKVARHTPPHDGDVWHLNLNRLGGQTNPQYSQWSPGKTKTPQFHAPQYFGRVVFSTMRVSHGPRG